MGQEQFVAIMPCICTDLISFISQKKNISEDDALTLLYSSKLYSILEDEQTKLWQYSTPMLYSLLEQEENSGHIDFPDV